jgi:ribosomal protein L34E
MRIVKCPSCGIVNRVRSHSAKEVPSCGRCKQPLPHLPSRKYNIYRRIWLPAVSVALLLGVLFVVSIYHH